MRFVSLLLAVMINRAAAAPLQVRTDEELLTHVEAFLERTAEHGMTATRFGIEAMREGGLVKSLREGRSLSVRNMNRVLSYIEGWRQDGSAPDVAVPSSGNGDHLSGSGTDAVSEADSPRPFAAAEEASPASSPTSIRTCPSCDAPATPTSPLPSSPGPGSAPAQDKAEAA